MVSACMLNGTELCLLTPCTSDVSRTCSGVYDTCSYGHNGTSLKVGLSAASEVHGSMYFFSGGGIPRRRVQPVQNLFFCMLLIVIVMAQHNRTCTPPGCTLQPQHTLDYNLGCTSVVSKLRRFSQLLTTFTQPFTRVKLSILAKMQYGGVQRCNINGELSFNSLPRTSLWVDQFIATCGQKESSLVNALGGEGRVKQCYQLGYEYRRKLAILITLGHRMKWQDITLRY